MTETKQTSTTKTDRRPDCVTEIRMGNSVLTVSGFFKQGVTDTAADKMMKVLQGESNSISNQELICKGWFLPPNTYDCGSFVVN